MNAQLDADEKLLWTGRPRQGVFLRASDAAGIPFGIMWLGFCLVWEAMALDITFHGLPAKFKIDNYFMGLWGLPFIGVGLYLVLFRFFIDAWRRRGTWYAVTNTRAIIISGILTRRTQSMNLAAMPFTELLEHRDGTGSIVFVQVLSADEAPQPPTKSFRLGSYTRGVETPHFEYVENAGEAHRIIRALQSHPAGQIAV